MELINLKFFIFVELNNNFMDKIFKVDEIKNILSDKKFNVLLNERYYCSISC